MRARLLPLAVVMAVLLPAVGAAPTGQLRAIPAVALAPALSPNPAHALAGATVSIAMTGFAPNQGVRVYWNRTPTWRGSLVCWLGVTDATGAAHCTFAVPTTAIGSFPVVAVADDGSTARTTVTAAGSVLGVGTYRVGATKEGLVGGETANGHVIVPHDHFVSLPACTELSCAWLRPGRTDPTYGYVIPCGFNCFVRVANPRTGACEVAPVYDLGPWFTKDDWWRGADDRQLNNLPSAVNFLPRGYVGADAALDGLNVGYGRGPSGIGLDNFGREVGLRAAVDLGDGTWEAIGLSSSGVDRAVVALLWETGEDHSAAAAACARGTAPTGTGSLVLSPSSGPVGTSIAVSGQGFRAGEIVDLFLDSTATTPVANVTADAGGAFAGAFKLPNRTAGYHKVAAKGRVSGLKTAKSFKVVPSLSRNPSQATAGSTVKLAARGFAARERVEVHWETAAGPVVAALTTSSTGSGSASFAIPTGTLPGRHDLIGRGLGSGLKAATYVRVVDAIVASVSVSPAAGSPRSPLSVTGSGFGAGEPVDLFWDAQATAAGGATADGGGTVGSYVVEIPLLPAGQHTVAFRGRTSGRRGSTSFTIVPSLSVSPSAGPDGTVVSVRGRGWDAAAAVAVAWDRTQARPGTPVCSATASASGSFTCSFAAPAGPGGTYPVVATGGARTATTSFTITDASAAEVDAARPSATATAAGDGAPATPPPSATADQASTGTPAVTQAEPPTPTPSETPRPSETPTAIASETPAPSEEPTEEPSEEATATPTEPIEATAEPSATALEASVDGSGTTDGENAPRPSVRLSRRAGPAGVAIRVRGRGFAPGPVEIRWEDDAVLASTEADADGLFSAEFAIPADAVPGPHVVVMRGADGRGLSVRFLVEG
jgi:hypothetical protein